MVLRRSPELTFTDTGTQITFTPEGTTSALTGITSVDVSGLTTMSTSVYVADVAHDVDNTDCLKLSGAYIRTTDTSRCVNQLWYFVIGMKC